MSDPLTITEGRATILYNALSAAIPDMTLVALEDMRQFFADENHWIKGKTWNDDKTRYCLVGYVYDHWHSYVCNFLDEMAREDVGETEEGMERETARFNDKHTHAEVLAFLDRAIATYKSRHRPV